MNWDSLLVKTGFAALLPRDYAHFAEPVRAGLTVFLQGLPEAQQVTILTEQARLCASASLAERLGILARNCPVLQKIGQVLARDQRLSLELRQHLRQLESLPPTVPLEVIQETLQQELGPLKHLGIRLMPPALAEASVAVVIPFCLEEKGHTRHGVFKILKPGIQQRLEEELVLLRQVGSHLDARCEELQLPHLHYQELFQQVREKLLEEIHLDGEQRKLALAKEFYQGEDRVLIPELFDCCTPRVTAMERIWGSKVTDHQITDSRDIQRLAETIVETMIAQPIFAQQNRALFHSDPHAGNIFVTTDGRLAILDWSLVGWLEKQERVEIAQLLLAAGAHSPGRMVAALGKMDAQGHVNRPKLRDICLGWLKRLRKGHLPGLRWLVGLLDAAVQEAGLRPNPDLMLFRKTLYTLEGVVAEVGAGADTFDRVMWREYLRHLTMEWPRRWFTLPNSREFATCLSNFDLTKAILNLPTSMSRYWSRQCLDCWDLIRLKMKPNT